MTDAVALWCGGEVVQVDASICTMATERVNWEAFQAPASVAPALTVTRRDALPDGTRVDAQLGSCLYRRDGRVLEVCVDDGKWQGELVLRLCWYLQGTAQGAALVHASGVTDGRTAFVAAGQSGDGKTTCARRAVEAGLSLLSDEVLLFFPDGRVSGTPFRSDLEGAGRPGLLPARRFVALRKAATEALEPLDALTATQLAVSQAFEVKEVPEVALARGALRQRVLSFLSHVELGRFAFRNDVAAGAFVRALLEA